MSFPHEVILMFNFGHSWYGEMHQLVLRKSWTLELPHVEKLQRGQADKKTTTYFTVVEQNPGPSGQKFSKPPLEELDEALKVISDED